MKKKTVFTAIFVMCAVALILGGFFLLHQKEKMQKTQKTQAPQSVYTLQDEAYFAAAQTVDGKLYESGIDGLFYTLSPVKYYAVHNGALVELPVKTTLKTAVEVAQAKMEFKFACVVYNKKTFAVARWHSDSGVYNEAFAVLLDMPQGFARTQKYLLLADTTRTDASAADRRFSEILCIDKKGTCGGYVFDQRNRTVESSGKLRADWDVLSFALLTCSEKKQVYSLSGKNYNRDEAQQNYDLRLTSAGATQTVAKRVSDCFFSSSEKSVIYLRAENAQFQVIENKAGKERVTATIKGNLEKDFVRQGDILLRKADNTVVLPESGEKRSAPIVFKSLYAVKRAGQKLVYIGKEQNRDGAEFKVQLIVIKDLATATEKAVYANDIFDEDTSLSLCADGILSVKGGKSVFISYNALEKLAADVIK